MYKHVHHGKTMILLFLCFLLLASLNAPGNSPPGTWGNSPSLRAVLSPGNTGVELSWEPRAGTSVYRVFRAPLTDGTAPYNFELLAELPADQTFFTDEPDPGGSVVYRVAAVGAGEFAYPPAAMITLNRFGGLVPISLEFHLRCHP